MQWGGRETEERTHLSSVLGEGRHAIVVDEQERIVGVSTEWTQMCGYSAEEAIGQSPKMLQGPRTHLPSASAFASTLKTERWAFASIVNYKKDGSHFVNHLFGWQFGDLFVAETYAAE